LSVTTLKLLSVTTLMLLSVTTLVLMSLTTLMLMSVTSLTLALLRTPLLAALHAVVMNLRERCLARTSSAASFLPPRLVVRCLDPRGGQGAWRRGAWCRWRH